MCFSADANMWQNIRRRVWQEWIQYWSLLNWHNLRFRCGCVAVPVNWFYDILHHVLLNLRTLYIVWSLVRRRFTRCLTRLKTMRNVLKYRKIFQNGSVQLWFGCGYFFNLLMFSSVFPDIVIYISLCPVRPRHAYTTVARPSHSYHDTITTCTVLVLSKLKK